MRVKGLRHRQPDRAEPDDADQQAVETGEVVGEHARAEGHVVAVADLGVGPGQASQQHRCAGHRVFGDRALLPPGTLATGMPSRVSVG